ncbi:MULTISPECIES: SdrD B-like domain-containing protein [unclassified Pseudoxanthomonas]|uniref:SdrD B-like domain-containing protein n=1 Tax=unclassified Pseudoxanthomonas TaxID=2645906 RepID=UPI001304DDDA|nr:MULTISPECIES: SdrD B-like domain-containing protein [unclassified Pseudoxanthomonas]
MLALLLVLAPGAHAAVTSAIVGTGTTQAPTGSTPLCSLDPAAADLNVCTNDTMIYNIEYSTNGGDSALTIVSTLPTCTAATPGCPANGIMAVWESVPPQCAMPGSSISPNGLTLTCVRTGPINAGTARILPIVRILGTTPNGASIPTPITTVTTPETAVPVPAVPTSGPVTVRAQPAFDLYKGRGRMTYSKGPDGVTDGWILPFDAGILVPSGARGIENLDANGISWDDVLANLTVTGTNANGIAGAPAVQAALRASAVLYPVNTSSGLNACWDNGIEASTLRDGAMPGGRGGPSINRLQTSGTCAVSQSGGAGGALSARIAGALWTNTVYPPRSVDNVPLPAGTNFVAAKQIGIWFPATVFSANLSDNATINISNTYTNVQGTSISGQPVVQPNVANDTTVVPYTYLAGSAGVIKFWVSYNTANNLRVSGNHTQDGVVVDGMPVFARSHMSNSGSAPLIGSVICEKIDNSKYHVFENGTVAADGGHLLAAGEYVIEYGTGGINGVGEGWANNTDYALGTCADDQSPAWYANRSAVPGGDVAITKVRLRALIPQQPSDNWILLQGVRMTATSPVNAMGVAAGYQWPIGTRVNNWNAYTFDGGYASVSSRIVTDSTGHNWLTGGPSGYTGEGKTAYQQGDTVTLVGARAEVTKETVVPDNAATQAVGGQPITYVLNPILSAAIATPQTSTMTVKDVLPPGLSYVTGSASLTPVVQNNTPSTGYTTLTWTLNNVAVGQPITPITFQAMVDVTLANGTYIPNFTVVSSPLDTRTCQASGGAYDGILDTGYTVDGSNGNVTGNLCVHAARKDLRVSNPGGFQVNKTAIAPQIEPGQLARYQLSWISAGNDLNSSDLIDVLPYSGDARGSTFSGTARLAGALGPVANDGTPASIIYYTSASPASISQDPNDPSNALSGGSTVWCTAAQIGSAGCPAGYAQVTAIRVASSGLQPDNTQRTLTVPLATIGNVGGNLYRNAFTIRGVAGGVPLTAAVTSPIAQVQVVTGSLSGTVFEDLDDDGLQDAGEDGIPGVDVTLDGCSSGADGVLQTTTLAGTGSPVCAGDDQPVTVTVQTLADGTYSFSGLVSGRYRITEAQPIDYADGERAVGTLGGTANARGTIPSVVTDIVVPAGATGTDYDFGEILSPPAALPLLTLMKQVTNDHGGTATASQFTLTANGPTTISGVTGDAAITGAAVLAGTYALAETNLPGYAAGTYSCTLNGGAAVSSNSLVLQDGDIAVCTVINDDQPATLTLVKRVINDNGGVAATGDFMLTANGPTPLSGVTGSTQVTSATVAAGAYALGETNLPGYTASAYSCVVNGGAAVSGNGISLANGDVAVCTITNDDQGATLTLVKTVTNDNGGAAQPADFLLTASGPSSISGAVGSPGVTSAIVQPGVYALAEQNLPGYAATPYSCVVNGAAPVIGNTVTLQAGDAAVCTIHNDDQVQRAPAAQLTLVKRVNNDDGGTAVPTDFILTATGPSQVAGATGAAAVTAASVSPGQYELSEINLPGYGAGLYACVVNGVTLAPSNTVTLADFDVATCTITNDDQGALLTLVKEVVNDNGGTAAPSDFTLMATGPETVSGVTGEAGITAVAVPAGSYVLSEVNLPGYVASDFSCVVNGTAAVAGNTLALSNGDTATCIVINDDQGATLTLVKQVINDDGGTAVATDFVLTASGPANLLGSTGDAAITGVQLSAGTYVLGERGLPGYAAAGWTCTAGTVAGDQLTLANGDNAVCTLVNNDEPAVLEMTKDLVGTVVPVAGSADRFVVRYAITVRHVSGSAGTYTLTDTPLFDSDARIQSARYVRGTESGQALQPVAGPWTLASERVLAIGASETYQVEVHVQVAAGSDTTNDRCGAGAGHGLFNRAVLTAGATTLEDDACADTPVPNTSAQLTVQKLGSVRQAELGDVVSYTLRIRNTGNGIAVRPVIVDRLPAGFRLADAQVRARGATLVSLEGAPGPVLLMTLDRIDPGAEVILAYRVRIGVGALEGDGINRAHAECRPFISSTSTQTCSNEDQWEVDVTAGVFSDEGGILGQIFVDCNLNAVKDREEIGIPGVRLYLEDGTYLVSDVEGKYSYWGLRPTTHVLKVDARTLPTRSRLVTSSPQNAGDAQSLFIDLKKGELHRADFIEGSCNNEVIEQVKARRAQGEIRSVQTETGQPGLKLESKPHPQGNPPQQGTDAANQPIERVRHQP